MLRPEVVSVMTAIHSYFLGRIRKYGEGKVATGVLEQALAEEEHPEWAIADGIAQFVHGGHLEKVKVLNYWEIVTSHSSLDFTDWLSTTYRASG